MPKKSSPPKYRLHKARNCAVVTIDGRNYYLGPFGSPESKQLYKQLIAEKWLSLDELPVTPPTVKKSFITIDELIARYMTKHVSNYHIDRHGKPYWNSASSGPSKIVRFRFRKYSR